MVEVFATSVRREKEAGIILSKLHTSFPNPKINFDLDDVADASPFCHSILRVEGTPLDTEGIATIVASEGYTCTVLEDRICQ